MGFSSLMKQLKRRFRQKRRWLALGLWLFIIAAAWAATNILKANDDPARNAVGIPSKDSIEAVETILEDEEPQWLRILEQDPADRSVIVQTVYICGEERRSLGMMKAADAIRLKQQHPEWEASVTAQEITFKEYVDDFSQECKETAYFGIDKNGNLSLFEGFPSEEHVIRTFFQMNIEQLKSSLPKEIVDELHQGIRVNDYAEYNSVLSTFSDFAVEAEETEKVMKPTD